MLNKRLVASVEFQLELGKLKYLLRRLHRGTHVNESLMRRCYIVLKFIHKLLQSCNFVPLILLCKLDVGRRMLLFEHDLVPVEYLE